MLYSRKRYENHWKYVMLAISAAYPLLFKPKIL